MENNTINIECVNCHFVNDMDGANFCRKCSTPLFNNCTNEECDYYEEFSLPIDSLYCHICQSKTILYDFLIDDKNQNDENTADISKI